MTTYSTDPALYIFTSLTAGSSHIVTATSRLETILRANRVPFKAVDIATDQKARMLWGRRAGKDDDGRLRKLPGLVQEGLVLGVSAVHFFIFLKVDILNRVSAYRTSSRSKTGTSMVSSNNTSKSTTTSTPFPTSTTSLPNHRNPRSQQLNPPSPIIQSWLLRLLPLLPHHRCQNLK